MAAPEKGQGRDEPRDPTDVLKTWATESAVARDRRITEFGPGLGGALHDLIEAEDSYSFIPTEAFHTYAEQRRTAFAGQLLASRSNRKSGTRPATEAFLEYADVMVTIRLNQQELRKKN